MTHKKHRAKHLIWIIPLGVLGIGLFVFVFMSLWNWLMPGIFGLPVITYFQALGLLLLSKLIFSGIGHSSPAHSKKKEYFQQKMEEKCCKPDTDAINEKI